MAAPGPLAVANIWFRNPAKSSASGDLGLGHRGHDGLGSVRCTAQASSSLDARNASMLAIRNDKPDRGFWPDVAQQHHLPACAGPNTQARAPPQLSQMRCPFAIVHCCTSILAE
jgi:hypothetical protein